MGAVQPWAWPALAAATCLLVGCGQEHLEVTNEVGPQEGSVAEEPDADARPEGEETPSAARPGPLTLAIREYEVLGDTRLCDLDGNGSDDNSIADLGNPAAAIFAATVTGFLSNPFYGDRTLLFHFPWIEDVIHADAGETAMIITGGIDPAPEGDPAEGQTYSVMAAGVDGCLEPGEGAYDAHLEGGVLTTGGDVPIGDVTHAMVLRRSVVTGTVDPEAGTAELETCSYLSIGDLGAFPADASFLPTSSPLSVLEVFLAGGVALALPGIPGVRLDVDVDGDGLERIAVDADGRITSCIDGDLTEIPGRECWADERMADGISLNVRLGATVSKLSGLGPRSWLVPFSGECDSGPLVDTAWGPCPDPEAAACQRNEPLPCTDTCGNAGNRRCDWQCTAPGRCFAETSSTVESSTCSDLLLGGGATCSDADGAAFLVSGPHQTGGVRLSQSITVGTGPITISGRARSAPGPSGSPGEGWRLLALIGEPPTAWAHTRPSARAEEGVTGYALEWDFDDSIEQGGGNDQAFVFVVDGPELFDFPCANDPGMGCNGWVWPGLGASTTGQQAQQLHMVVVPDDPETAEDETAVAPFRAGNYGPVLMGGGCHAGSCPITITPGEVLTVALTASTTSNDAVVEVPLEGGITVTAIGTCD